ncbi:hypothetical protein [Acinetobacter bereziniae]|uniref:hypothetical protein n=1 Tax=Acinetobacter bereziniae TaxID=106648 RepID=UPI001900E52D|nr:hypothetical protein [Acinetobacter bereziniae]MBJ8474365.1 hypothetical protein [Acinetobacter bereziniae]
MTTINNLTIEQMREIVEGAPTQDCFYDTYEGLFYSKDHDHYWEWWDSDCKEWFECEFVVNQNEDGFLHLNNLRTAIAKHDSPEFKVGDLVVCTNRGFNEVDKIREFDSDGYFTTVNGYYCNPRVFRHATPSEIKAGHRIDKRTDHVTDIRNQVSPSTIVKDLEAERHG